MSEDEQKKSVAFGETTNLENGEKVELNDASTAEPHSVAENGDAETAPTFDPSAPKKKKKPKKEKESEAGEEAPQENGEGVEGFNPNLLKKKSKPKGRSKKKPADEEDEFGQRLKALGLEDKEDEPAVPQTQEEVEAELQQGTGVWAQDNTTPFKYSQLLKRFYINLYEDHPELSGDGRLKNYKIPPPQVAREGNKKSIFANLPEIAKKMKRNPEHIIQFIFAELGTNGSVDGAGRLVIKGRFQQKQLESVLRRYIVEYLTCGTCKSPNTTLMKENRLFFVNCNICGSRKSVSAIKTGFQAALGKRKKQQA